MMLTSNPFAALEDFWPPLVMQVYIVLMMVAVVLGTLFDVHHKGKAVVSNGPREKAELDVFRLHEHGLWATMQHDE